MIPLVAFMVILLLHVKDSGHNLNLLIAGSIVSVLIGLGISFIIQFSIKLVGGH